MYELTRENVNEMALATISDIWSQIDWDKVDGKRAMGIWDEFISKIKASSMTTNSYEKFVEKLCRKMEVRSLRFKNIEEISNQDENFKKAILRALREETQTIVLRLRINNQVKKEMAQQEKLRKEKEEKLQEKLNNTQVSFTEKGVKANEN
ncbi:hypothetical protein [Clostridium perfringens]|uniref:hypothetical protein n=1 Tax=Clostridium perfringens TaxID=1502 RepID=UPI0039EA2F6B